MIQMNYASILRCLLVVWATMVMPLAGVHAQNFPDKSITLVVPWPAGGPTDRHARVLAELAGAQLGQQVIIDNRPGAGGTLGLSNMALNARADGYTIGLYSNGMLRVPHLQKTAWHPIDDFTFIAGVSVSTGGNFGFVVRADSPYKSFHDFREAARKEPGKLSFGSAGLGSTVHLLVEELAEASSMQLVHVPYKGSPEMMQALMGGHLSSASDLSGGWESLVEKGQLRLLLTFGERLSTRWPGVPTAKSLGYDIVGASSYGIVGPKGMDPATVKVLQDVFGRVVKEPRHLAVLDQLSQEPWFRAGETYRQWAGTRFEKEKILIRRLGLLAN
jgi:tripartite-type tricarboxylate transporter receptor subunit TctC